MEDRTHLVYFHPDKKNGYGATRIDRWPGRIEEQGLDVGKGYIVEKDLTLEEASERETFYQRRDGFPTDKASYIQSNWNNKNLCQTPQAIKKRVAKFKQQHRAKGWGKELIKVYKARVLRVGSRWVTERGEYIDTVQGIDNVKERFNLKHRSGIGNVLYKRNGAASYQGYTFEFA